MNTSLHPKATGSPYNISRTGGHHQQFYILSSEFNNYKKNYMHAFIGRRAATRSMTSNCPNHHEPMFYHNFYIVHDKTSVPSIFSKSRLNISRYDSCERKSKFQLPYLG